MGRGIDRVELAPDVELARGEIRDRVLGQAYPISPSAWMVLVLLQSGAAMDRAPALVSRTLNVDAARAREDVWRLIVLLNSAGLVNVRGVQGPRGIVRAAVDLVRSALLPTGACAWSRRHRLRSDSALRAHGDVAAGVALGLAPLWIGITALCGVIALGRPGTASALAFPPALFLALVTHEAGHALAVARIGGGCFLVTRPLSAAVVYLAGRPAPWIHAAGCLAALAWGTPILLGALLTHSPALAIASAPFLAQLMTLTAWSADGRQLVAPGWRGRVRAP